MSKVVALWFKRQAAFQKALLLRSDDDETVSRIIIEMFSIPGS